MVAAEYGGGTRDTATGPPGPAWQPAGPAQLRREIAVVLALSLGADAVSAVISLIGSLTAPANLPHQQAELLVSRAPGRPWLDLAWQLFSIATPLVPVLLVAYLLARENASFRDLGIDRTRPAFDTGLGATLAAGVGGAGLLLYLAAVHLGADLTVVPTTLPDVWWRIPVEVLDAAQNAIVEEVIVVGYLLRRLDQLGTRPGAATATSALLRGSYHLYQGFGGFLGNAAMGVIFATVYRRYHRVAPLIIAHTIMDTAVFVGYTALAGHVSWLPT